MSTGRPSISGDGEYTLLKTLNTFTRRYNLCVRVVDRTPLTEFTNKRTNTPGYIMNCTVIDTEGVCMHCKFWNAAAKKFDTVIQKDNVLRITNGGRICISNKRFSSLQHNYELTFDQPDCDIAVLPDSEFPDLPKEPCLMKYKFNNLRTVALSPTKLPYFTSTVVIIHDVQPTREIQIKRNMGNGEATTIRSLLVVDPTKHSIELTLWGALCNQFPYEIGQVVFLQNVQVRQGNRQAGIQLTTSRTTEIYVNPEQHEYTQQYQTWYQSEGCTTQFKPLSETAEQTTSTSKIVETDLKGLQTYVDGLNAMPDDTPVQFKISGAFITDVAYTSQRPDSNKFTLVYESCVNCNKKVSDQGICPSCQGDSTIPKFTTTISVCDDSASNVPVRVFNDQAQTIFNRQPRQIKDLIESGNISNLKDIVEFASLWKVNDYTPLKFQRYNLVIRARRDMFNNVVRVSLTLNAIQPITYHTYIANAMKTITQFLPDAFEVEASPAAEAPLGDAKRIKIDV